MPQSRRPEIPLSRKALGALLGSGLGSGFAVAATLTPLGDLPGGIYSSFAGAISADGSTVVGWSAADRNRTVVQAYYWNRAEGMVGLKDFPGGLYYSRALDVSQDGTVVVGEGSGTAGTEAFRWTREDGLVGLGDLPGGRHYSVALGVSRDGDLVVGVSESDQQQEGFLWSQPSSDQGIVAIPKIPGVGLTQFAGAVLSNPFTVVGGAGPDEKTEAYRWSELGLLGLGDWPGGDYSSAAGAISADGEVIVGSVTTASGVQAASASPSGVWQLLSLPQGTRSSLALDVSADGSVIVGWIRDDAGFAACFWTRSSGFERLWDALKARGFDPALDGWTTLQSAVGVSDDGRFVAGNGTRNGNPEAFLADLSTDTSSPPRLDWKANGDGTLTLSWEAADGFVLESASTADGPGWAPVEGVVNDSVTVPMENTSFFRLRK